tara:strand:+ start:276 stop:485 length:210 start_codon:yes stop_codon:yes gene_type:complete
MARFAFGGASAQTHTFTNSTEVSITHGLGHKPLVSVIVDNKMCWADVTYDDTQVVIRFQNSTTGIIVLR